MGVLFKIRAIKCRVDMWREKNRLNQSKGAKSFEVSVQSCFANSVT